MEKQSIRTILKICVDISVMIFGTQFSSHVWNFKKNMVVVQWWGSSINRCFLLTIESTKPRHLKLCTTYNTNRQSSQRDSRPHGHVRIRDNIFIPDVNIRNDDLHIFNDLRDEFLGESRRRWHRRRRRSRRLSSGGVLCVFVLGNGCFFGGEWRRLFRLGVVWSGGIGSDEQMQAIDLNDDRFRV